MLLIFLDLRESALELLIESGLELVGSLVKRVSKALGDAGGRLSEVLRDQSHQAGHVISAEVLQVLDKLGLNVVEDLVGEG